MKQLYQIPKSGQMFVAEVPIPQLGAGMLLVHVAASLVSAGTERMAVDFAQKSLIQKARSRPDLVRQVMDKARREGILSTLEAANRKLDQPQSLGYSCAGTVIGIGEGVEGFSIGDRVACAGAGYAVHAEIVCVPKSLVVPIPPPSSDRVISFDQAAFTTIGAIAMHGLRLAQPQFGESVAVIGLGVIGLVVAQLAKAAGCTVLGMEPNASRAAIAESLGCDAVARNAEEFEALVSTKTSAAGADSVVISAATSTSGPVELAGLVARKRARVVAVGAVGTDLPRKVYYEKELHFVISKSYGPGRYDIEYEEKGHDYPREYVRWTENRNMASFLELLTQGKVTVQPLITHRFSIENALQAYQLISGKPTEPFLGVVIEYPNEQTFAPEIVIGRSSAGALAEDVVALGLVGAGNFATSVLIPAFKACDSVAFKGICTARGVSARHTAEKFGFEYCASDYHNLLSDTSINTVIIATRHSLHARLVEDFISADKNVFCEKPLCISRDELDRISTVFQDEKRTPLLMVGFNRRFSPMALTAREFFRAVKEPLVVQCRINAGYIPADSWIQDSETGGGRVVGEVCHFVDLIQFLAGSNCESVFAEALPNQGRYCSDNVAITMKLENGSIGSILYLANGDKSVSKERIEIFGGGRTAVLNDFRTLDLVHDGRTKTIKSRFRQDKGHAKECSTFVDAVRKGLPSPISFESIYRTTLTTFEILESLRTRMPAKVRVGARVAPDTK